MADTTTSPPGEAVEQTADDPFQRMDPEMAKAPQAAYQALRAAMRVMPMEDSVILGGRAEVDDALRNHALYSSNMSAVDLQNVRPLIPLQIDPPEHKQYRRILDPIFAPKKMAVMEGPVTDLVNDLIDRFGDRREINFATDFSTLFPTQVFLVLFGLPVDELATFLAMKDGIIRPHHVTGTEFASPESIDYQKATASSVYAYFEEVLDRRQPGTTRRPPEPVPRHRDRRPPAHPPRDPRHLLPVAHRRARHRHGHPRLHVRLPGPAPGPTPSDLR